MKRKEMILGSTIVLLTILLILGLINPSKVNSIERTPVTNNVKIVGAVLIPGFYDVSETNTLRDLINFAGGLLHTADQKEINFEERLIHREYVIPFMKSFIEEIDKDEEEEVFVKFNLNVVTPEQLSTVPSMTANRISAFLEYRQQVIIIRSVEELLNVKGIGPATFEKIVPYFTV